MPYASEQFTGSAGVLDYTFGAGTGSLTGGLKFLSSAHLSVTVDGASVAFTVPAGHASFTMSGVSIAGGEVILVRRTTPATEAGRLVNFEDLSHVRQVDLDRSALQLLYLAQEALDVVAANQCLALGGNGQWDGLNKRLENIDVGTDADHAVTKAQLDAASVAAGNLPVVGAGDNDKSLWVVSGAWSIRTPSQARTHLGLGTAALLNVGTGAAQVVQFDGSARYPSNDGRNIDLTNNALAATINLRYRSTVAVVRNSTEQTPATDATSTWSETAGSRLIPGTKTSLDDSGDVVVDAGLKKVTLSAGTWEMEYVVRVYNNNGTDGDDQDIRVKVTDAVDGPSQVVYDAEHDRVSVESPGANTRAMTSLHNILLLKLPTGGDIVLRAVNEDGANLRIPSTMMMFRKVSTSTA